MAPTDSPHKLYARHIQLKKDDLPKDAEKVRET